MRPGSGPGRRGPTRRGRTGPRAAARSRCIPCATAPTVAPLIYVFFLLLVTAVWGWTFVLVKDAITQYPTLPFLQLRFLLPFLVMLVLVHPLPARRELRLGIICRAVLPPRYLPHTLGLTM